MIEGIDGRVIEGHRPWPRVLTDQQGWASAARQLATGEATMLALFGERNAVHLALLGRQSDAIAVISFECTDGRYPSVGALHPPAIRLERALHDLYGLEPVGLPDRRPWLDLGFWDTRHPLAENSAPASAQGAYQFLPVEGDHLHQIPVGPVHAGIIEPGHFRFTANGETVVRLEERLGYVHKGIESLMAGASIERAARLAGRASGDSTVAYALAFARAVEAAAGIDVPLRAIYLRAAMAELERLANHFGDIGAICNDASFSIMLAQCAILRERTLRTADRCFGHRLMMDCVVPGGIASAAEPATADALIALVEEVRQVFPQLIELYDNTASLQDRTAGTGVLDNDLARRYGAGGYVGRASGRAFDARKTPGCPPYENLSFEMPVLEAGDVNARVWVRIREVEQSLALIEQLVRRLPDGPVLTPLEAVENVCEGIALVEGFRGDVLAWVRLRGDRVVHCHLRDPSVFQWPLLEAAIEGNIVADFPLCNKSFNCSYSGHDL